MTSDRRRNGVQHVAVEDSNTGRVTSSFQVQGTVAKWKAWVGIAATLLTIGAVVAGATRMGVRSEVIDEINIQSEPPSGHLYQMADACAEKRVGDATAMIRRELHARITETNDVIADEVSENREEIVEVRTRQEAMIVQLERMEQTLLQEIRRGR